MFTDHPGAFASPTRPISIIWIWETLFKRPDGQSHIQTSILNDDVVIALSRTEHKFLQAIASEKLERDFRVSMPQRYWNEEWLNYWMTVYEPIRMRPLPEKCDAFFAKLELETDHMYFINQQYRLFVPSFLMTTIKYIEKYGLKKSNIFLAVGDPDRLMELEAKLHNGEPIELNTDAVVYEMASLLKKHLQVTEEGLFPKEVEEQIFLTRGYDLRLKIDFYTQLIRLLPQASLHILYMVLALLAQIARTPDNGMDSDILNDIFSRVLFRNQNNFVNKGWGSIKILIEFFPKIFVLEACNLDRIYKEMQQNDRAKLALTLLRRTNQCFCDPSDIPVSMRLLRGRNRSYDFDTMHEHLSEPQEDEPPRTYQEQVTTRTSRGNWKRWIRSCFRRAASDPEDISQLGDPQVHLREYNSGDY